MKTASNLFAIITVAMSLIYSYTLLSFIQATGALWGIWAMSIVAMLASTLLSRWARDEYYQDEFKKVIAKAISEVVNQKAT
jgi:hypothetical protein